jgi:hypothetical protein
LASTSSKSSRELELEHKIRLLEDEFNKEKLKTSALSTLIDIAEWDLQIDIKKSVVPNNKHAAHILPNCQPV